MDSSFTNARLTAEFFRKMPGQDLTARAFVPAWRCPPDLGKRMDRVWPLSLKQVVLLSRDRIPTEPEQLTLEDLSYGGLGRITRDANRALPLLIEAHERDGGQYVEQLRDTARGTWLQARDELAAMRRGPPKPLTIGHRVVVARHLVLFRGLMTLTVPPDPHGDPSRESGSRQPPAA
ncbi:hypothetical protein [Marmoricola endophyticus]|uniref:hypothetical protein n=1 Tax=Marmoricola endophyticus TaxID=2040280 RepID=UPI0016668484|nr:hypothetical protein [Marmoricola endophyticus]